MIRGSQFIDIDEHHIIAGDIVAHKTNIIDHGIITNITADNSTVIKPDRHPEIIEFMEIGLQFADTYKSVKFTVPDKRRIKGISNQHHFPVIGAVSVFHQNFYRAFAERPVDGSVSVLPVAQIIFIFSFGYILLCNKAIAQ